MKVLEIALLVIGALIFVLSFIIPAKKDEVSGDINGAISSEVKKQVGTEIEGIRSHVDKVVDEAVEYAQEKTERSLERISNEKIMAVNEYSGTVLEEINKNHKEVMFLYDMLKDKHDELLNTVTEVNQAAANAKESTKEAYEAAAVAKENANVAKEAADAAQVTADAALLTADAAKETANVAKEAANVAKETTNAAKETANAAQVSMNDVAKSIESASASFRTLAPENVTIPDFDISQVLKYSQNNITPIMETQLPSDNPYAQSVISAAEEELANAAANAALSAAMDVAGNAEADDNASEPANDAVKADEAAGDSEAKGRTLGWAEYAKQQADAALDGKSSENGEENSASEELDVHEEILTLHNLGKSDTEIAKALGMGVGEVSLIIGLHSDDKWGNFT